MTGDPVFLCGGDRSGVGLVGEMLEMHPAFSLTRRTNFFSYYADRFEGLASASETQVELVGLLRDRRFKLFAQDAEGALKDYLSGERTAARMFESLQLRRMERLGRRRWGDKSLWSEQHADVILGSYPTAVMVHVIRDPRDQFASYKFHRRDGSVSAGVGGALLRRSLKYASRNLAKYPNRYRTLRYEDLVAAPESTLRALCDFLNEDFAVEMFDLPTDPGDRSVTRRVIHGHSVGRYVRDLSEMEVATVERLVGPRMIEFGYEPRARLHGVRRLAFGGLYLPMAVGQSAAWTVRSSVRRIRGVGPSSSRLSQ